MNPRALKLSMTGCSALAMAMGENSSIQRLDLSWNKIGPQSAIQLSGMLSVSRSLRSLSLAYNGIKDQVGGISGFNSSVIIEILQGVEAISGCLRDNVALLHLDLSFNCITGDGCFMLSYALRHNASLQLLDLSGTHDSPRQVTSSSSHQLYRYQPVRVD